MNPAYNKILNLLSENDTRPGNPIPSSNVLSAHLLQKAMLQKTKIDNNEAKKRHQERMRQSRQPGYKKVFNVLTNPPLGREPEGKPDSNVQHYMVPHSTPKKTTQPRPELGPDTPKNKAPRRPPTRGRRKK